MSKKKQRKSTPKLDPRTLYEKSKLNEVLIGRKGGKMRDRRKRKLKMEFYE